MYDDFSPSALTEVSLALAMGVFALLVLSLIGMGSGEATSDQNSTRPTILSLIVKPSSDTPKNMLTQLNTEDLFVVYYDGILVDRNLVPVKTKSITDAPRVILGIDPSIAAGELVSIRANIEHPNVITTTLTQDWLSRLDQTLQPAFIEE